MITTQTPVKHETNFSYLYPIFHYEVKYDLIETNSTNQFVDTSQLNETFPSNNYNPLDSLDSQNKLKSNKSQLFKFVKPRYRFKNNHFVQSTENPVNKFQNNFTVITQKDNPSNFSDSNKGFTKISSTVEYKTEKLIQGSNETSIDYNKDEQNSFLYDSKSEKINQQTVKNQFSIFNEIEILRSFANHKTFTNNSERFCISSGDCYTELNERCITFSKYSVCGCKEPFFRETITHKCQIKKLIRLIFKLSSLNYSNELNNTNSFEYIQMKHIIERAIWAVIINSTHLLTIVDNIKVVKFSPFLVIVDFYAKIANPTNSFHHRYMEYHFWYKLMSAIKGINIGQKPTDKFSVLDLKAIEIDNNINYCSIKELNYCSENAICTENHNSESKFECKCKHGLADLSPNANFSGEICAVKCNSDFCGTGGFCEIRNGTHLHCICTNWSFGSRCQYSTNVILSVGALFVILSILFAFCCASVYCGYKIRLEFYGLRSMIEVSNQIFSCIFKFSLLTITFSEHL